MAEGERYEGGLDWLPEGDGRKYSAEGLIFDWNGAHTINVRYPKGQDFDVMSVGYGNPGDAATPAEVEEAIRSYLGEHRHEHNPDRESGLQSSADTKEKITRYRHDVQRPGKFEGEAAYVPYFWEIGLEFSPDETDEDAASGLTVYSFNVEGRDVKLFPELAGKRVVRLVETNDGFVQEIA